MHLYISKLKKLVEHITLYCCDKFDVIWLSITLVVDLQSWILDVLQEIKSDVHFSVALQKSARHDNHYGDPENF